MFRTDITILVLSNFNPVPAYLQNWNGLKENGFILGTQTVKSTIFWQIFSPEFCHFLRNLSLQLCTICNPLQFIIFLVIFLLELGKSKMTSKANDRLFRYLTFTGPLQWILIDGFKVPKNVNILRVLNLELFLLWICYNRLNSKFSKNSLVQMNPLNPLLRRPCYY